MLSGWIKLPDKNSELFYMIALLLRVSTENVGTRGAILCLDVAFIPFDPFSLELRMLENVAQIEYPDRREEKNENKKEACSVAARFHRG